MSIDSLSALRRGVAYASAAVIISLAVGACNDSTSSDGTRDRVPPRVTLTPGGSAGSVVSFSTNATDNLGLKTVHVLATGAVSLDTTVTFSSAVTNFTLPSTLSASTAVPAGTPVIIIAEAIDGAGNSSGVDTLIMATGNLPPPEVRVISPFSGSSAVVGKSILVTVMGKSALKVVSLGYSTTGPVVGTDSVLFSSPLRDSTTMQDTVVIPATASPGTLTITPFLRDSLGQRATGPAITITVQTAAQVNSVPVVNQYCIGNQIFNNACGHGLRVEVGDTVHVEADDPSGISALGYEVRRTVGGAIDDTQTFASNGQLTFLPHTFAMRLPYSTFPTVAYIQTFAVNSNGVRAYSKLQSGLDRIDTVMVVAGVTRELPFGGQVADALYHPGKDRLYLTNIQRNQVEVFNLADSSFKAPVIVGSRPWGLAGWPRNRAGDMGDTILVANSGGTNISYVDLNNLGLTGTGSGLEVARYQLPNIVVYTITSTLSSTTGLPIQVRTKYDFSDRPQFLGATCIAPAAVCSEVVLTYSTTPTAGQSEPFASRNGTLRFENLTRGVTVAGSTDLRTSHFFFEQAIGQGGARGDTLEIVRYDANGVDSTILVPYRDAALRSTIVTIELLAFRDTTFVRNSGDFHRAVFGEGGSVFGSRAMMFDADRGPELGYPYIDRGVSPPADVTDFIANTFAQVTGVAINFDGSLSAIRADSTYILSPALRLQGVLNTTFTNAGLDFHPQNTGLNSFPLNTRLAFAASSEPLIEIYDTNCYQRVGTIPIKDPIIGPIKAAFQIATGQLVVVGATVRGVVIAQLPNTFTTTCP
ncbi:MAG: hypothetical protein WD802_10270 [Gemmatimonadaceae bacterium]